MNNKISDKKTKNFWDLFVEYANKKNLSNAKIYKSAGISKETFSKRYTSRTFNRDFVLRIAIGLHLNMEEATCLLQKAGYAFSDAFIEDCVITDFIKRRTYNWYLIEIEIDKKKKSCQ